MRVTKKEPCGNDGFTIEMEAVTSGSPENERFFRWTPGGHIAFYTINAAAAAGIPDVGGECYIDINPADVYKGFDSNLEVMTFGQAIEAMRAGCRAARKGWNGKGMYIELQIPDKDSKMSLPYFYIKSADGKLVPWIASQTDMLAEDWVITE
jgi:hypothetical protein